MPTRTVHEPGPSSSSGGRRIGETPPRPSSPSTSPSSNTASPATTTTIIMDESQHSVVDDGDTPGGAPTVSGNVRGGGKCGPSGPRSDGGGKGALTLLLNRSPRLSPLPLPLPSSLPTLPPWLPPSPPLRRRRLFRGGSSRKRTSRAVGLVVVLAAAGALAVLHSWGERGGGGGGGAGGPATASRSMRAAVVGSGDGASPATAEPTRTLSGFGAHLLVRRKPDLDPPSGGAEARGRIEWVHVDGNGDGDGDVTDRNCRSSRGNTDDHPASSNNTATNNARCQLPFVGFVRITKTASTNLLDFLNSLSPRLVTYDRFLDYPAFFRDVAKGDLRSARGIIPACVFGAGLGPHFVLPAPGNNDTGATMLPAYAWQCPHTTYRGVVATWARGIPYLDERPPSTLAEASSASLRVFTVVREPTDRFVSYFHYWRHIYPHWKDLATSDEHDRLVRGDLEGFLELQSKIPSSLTINSAFQYRYLSDDVDEAVAMVRNRPARVLVLINECFELSLRLLASMFPHFVEGRDVDAFLRQTYHQKYTQGNASVPIVLRATSQLRPVQPYHMDEIRNKSRQWLRDDYRFYRAAVEQFRQSLEASSLDADSIHECYRRLDDIAL